VNGVQVTGIGDNALLNNTNITEIKIPDSVTNIGQMAFESCPSLRYITCGKGVAQIGPYAFANCNFLSTASFKGNAPTVDSTAFNNDTNVTVYYLPGTTGWGPSLANIPAVLWNPGIGGLRIISNFNYMGEGVVLSITNTAVLFTLETSTNLLNPWLPTVGPFSGTGPLTVFFPGLSNYPTRFFRLNMP
jgi:hypothetical protein